MNLVTFLDTGVILDSLWQKRTEKKKKNLLVIFAIIAAAVLLSPAQSILHLNLLNNKLFSDLIPKQVANISENKQPTCLATGAIPSLTCF